MASKNARSGRKESTVVVLAALIANAVIAVAKFIAALATGSSAMLSEGIHSVADTSNQALLLLGGHRIGQPADDEHPFGYGQELYFWGLIVAIVLFGIGGGLSIYEGVHRVLAHAPANESDPLWNYVVLGIAFAAEGTSWIIATRKLAETRKENRSFLEALGRSKDPRLFVPVAEDTAALAGIVVAFFGVLLSHALGKPWIDSAASIVIGVILAAVAIYLARETKHLLIGERVDPRLERKIRDAAEASPLIHDIGRILTMHLAPHQILLNLEVRVDDDARAADIARDVNAFETRLRARAPDVTRVFVELQAAGEEGGMEPPF